MSIKRLLAAVVALVQLASSVPSASANAVVSVSVQGGGQAVSPTVGAMPVGGAMATPMGGRATTLQSLSLGPSLPGVMLSNPVSANVPTAAIGTGGVRRPAAAPAVETLQTPAALAPSGAAPVTKIRTHTPAPGTQAAPSANTLSKSAQGRGAAATATATPAGKTASSLKTISRKVGKLLKLGAFSKDAPVESSSSGASKLFAALRGEKLIKTSNATLTPTAAAAPQVKSRLRVLQGGLRRSETSGRAAKKSAAKLKLVETLKPAGTTEKTPFWKKSSFRKAATVAGTLASAAALAIFTPQVGAVAATGSILLSVIGVPQIVKNFKQGKEGVKDLAIASTLIWFAAATLLSVVSIGQGTSLWWNVANLAGVAESAIVLGQINYHQRSAKNLKLTALTVGATLAPIPLIAMGLLFPLSTWLSVAFTAAMGLLWILNWPQVSQNFRIFQKEGRPPKGIAPLYPALVAIGSALHLYAALMGADFRWAMNAIIAIVTAGMVLAQIYTPRAANAVLGPLVKLTDKIVPGKKEHAAPDAKLVNEANETVARAFRGKDLSRFEAEDPDGQIDAVVEAARNLPGRSVIYLEAPTAAGKSTLANSIEETLGKRVKSLEIDRYFKSKQDIPVRPDGQPDFDRPDALLLDLAADHVRALLAGERIELPYHDMATEQTELHSGEYMELGEDEVLIIDSIFASHEKLINAAKGRKSLNVYLSAPAIIRLKRRLLRDRDHRGTPPKTTLERWAGILENEREHILPLRKEADEIINLVSAQELETLPETYAAILAEVWSRRGQDPEVTRLLLRMIRQSLQADEVIAPPEPVRQASSF